MSSEILAVPEDHVLDVIEVIRAGLGEVDVPQVVSEHLEEWCDSEEAYMLAAVDD